ncbi:MAG: type 1 glutamine amidotransferase [Synergistaceae bacterium]|jgi:protease I|nr:type 1 glutamine amidotransferase [Synergistaceae bacterium]
MGAINGRFLIFVDDLYEDLELWYPKLRLIEAGAAVTVAGPKAGTLYSGKHSYPCVSDAAIDDVTEGDFTGLVIPGGFAPDKLRRMESVKALTSAFMSAGKLVAHICHGGWIPASAGVCKGFRMTSTVGIKDDLVNAGAIWIDEPVVVDRNMISSRRPDDAPYFMKGIFEFLSRSAR